MCVSMLVRVCVCVCVCVCVYVCTRERVLGQTGIWSALHVLLRLLET